MTTTTEKEFINTANFFTGMSEVPSELYNYGGLAGNRILTAIGAISPDRAIDMDAGIRRQAEYLKPVKQLAPGYDKFLKEQSLAGDFRSGGQVGAGALMGGMFPRALGVNLDKGSLAKLLHGIRQYGGGVAYPAAGASTKALAEEAIIEPYLDGP